MKHFLRKHRLLLAALLLAFVAALALRLPQRVSHEFGGRDVGFVLSYEELTELADASGETTQTWAARFADMGLAAVVVGPEQAQDASVRAALGSLPLLLHGGDPALIGEGFLPLYITEDAPAQSLLPELAERGIALVLVENRYQTGPELPADYYDVLTDYGTSFVKCFWLNHTFRARYGVLGYGGAEEIENILYRAATDRTVRLLWCAPFMDGERMVTAPEEYAAVFSSLSQRISRQGLTLGAGISVSAPFTSNRVGLALGGVAVALAGLLVLLTLLTLPKKLTLALALVLSAGCIALAFVWEGAAQKLFAFGAASLFPCLASCLALSLLRTDYGGGEALGRLCLRFLAVLAASVAIALAGGLLVGAILAERDYMLELSLFSGVKLSQLIPLGYTLVVGFKLIYHERGRSLGGDLRALGAGLARGGRMKLLAAAIVLLLAAVVFILRTGDGMLGVPALEQRVRNFLETALYARPRTKEMLIAFPACALAVLAASRGWKNLLLPLGFLFAIGCASVCNTFCHIRAEVLLSLLRTLLGLGIGFVLGALALLVVGALVPAKKRNTRRDI